MSASRKRKHRYDSHTTHNANALASTADLSPDPALFIQAYEADIIRGPNAALAAISLEVSKLPSSSKSSDIKVGNALIKWEGHQHGVQPAFPDDDDDDDFGGRIVAKADDEDAIWVDRYDARLLLDTLPLTSPPGPTYPTPESPGGWSDLPSDDEDIFFFSPEEADDFRREKKRLHIDRIREERLKARRAEDGQSSEEEEEAWGGSDEEPDETQKALMRRTATHLLESPNPAQLEMRILANHGGDKRFAFLRGRWSRTWRIFKEKARIEKENLEKANAGAGGGLGTLADYGDSDDDSGVDDAVTDAVQPEITPNPEARDLSEAAAMEARRARAREWAEKRRAAKDTSL